MCIESPCAPSSQDEADDVDKLQFQFRTNETTYFPEIRFTRSASAGSLHLATPVYISITYRSVAWWKSTVLTTVDSTKLMSEGGLLDRSCLRLCFLTIELSIFCRVWSTLSDSIFWSIFSFSVAFVFPFLTGFYFLCFLAVFAYIKF